MLIDCDCHNVQSPDLEFQTPTLKLLPLIYQMVPARHLRTQCQLGGELLPLKSGNQDRQELVRIKLTITDDVVQKVVNAIVSHGWRWRLDSREGVCTLHAQSLFWRRNPTKTLGFLLPWISPCFFVGFLLSPHPMHSRF